MFPCRFHSSSFLKMFVIGLKSFLTWLLRNLMSLSTTGLYSSRIWMFFFGFYNADATRDSRGLHGDTSLKYFPFQVSRSFRYSAALVWPAVGAWPRGGGGGWGISIRGGIREMPSISSSSSWSSSSMSVCADSSGLLHFTAPAPSVTCRRRPGKPNETPRQEKKRNETKRNEKKRNESHKTSTRTAATATQPHNSEKKKKKMKEKELEQESRRTGLFRDSWPCPFSGRITRIRNAAMKCHDFQARRSAFSCSELGPRYRHRYPHPWRFYWVFLLIFHDFSFVHWTSRYLTMYLATDGVVERDPPAVVRRCAVVISVFRTEFQWFLMDWHGLWSTPNGFSFCVCVCVCFYGSARLDLGSSIWTERPCFDGACFFFFLSVFFFFFFYFFDCLFSFSPVFGLSSLSACQRLFVLGVRVCVCVCVTAWHGSNLHTHTHTHTR